MFLEGLIANCIIPMATLLFPAGSDWFASNFSVLGSSERRLHFILWGSLVGLYFYSATSRIFRFSDEMKTGVRHANSRALQDSSGVLLAMAILTPYLPGQFPVRSALHVLTAFGASVCFLASLLLLTYQLQKQYPWIYGTYYRSTLAIAFCSSILFLLVGIVSSALEVYFVISCSLLLYQLHRRLTLESGF